jgi:hypothetical protein
MRIKAATQLQSAEAFCGETGHDAALGRPQLTDAGMDGLLPERKGPKRKSKLTGDTVAAIRRLREGRDVLSRHSRRHRGVGGQGPHALESADADVDGDERCAPTGSDNACPQEQEQEQEQEVDVEAAPEVEVGPVPEVDAGGEDDCAATVPAVMAPSGRSGRDLHRALREPVG